MLIYLLLYFSFFLCACFELFLSGRRKIVTIFLVASLGLAVILIAGMRWETGTDWITYRYFFETIETRNWSSSGMELGYEMLVRFFKMLSGEQTVFLFFCASFIVLLTYYTLYKHSPYPLFSLFLLISYSLVGIGFGVRQDLAIAITLFSITYIIDRSLIKFVLLVSLAAFIHKSSLIFLPAYYLYNFRWNLVKALTAISISIICVLMSETIMQTFGSLVEERKAELYMEMGMDMVQDPYTSLVKGLSGRFLFLLITIGFVKYDDENKIYNGIFNLYVFGILIYVTFSPINLIFSRLARPYDIFQIIILPLVYAKATRLQKAIIITIIIAFSVLKFYTFIKADDGVNIPYKSILSR
jgi:hypothetical protein